MLNVVPAPGAAYWRLVRACTCHRHTATDVSRPQPSHGLAQYGGPTATRRAGEGAEQLDPSEAARIFEGQLANALLAEDGQLALSNLAASTVSTLMPKVGFATNFVR